jgi:hypothetical protein
MSPDSQSSIKQISLPFRVVRTSVARRATVRYLAIGILVIATVAGGVAYAISDDLLVVIATIAVVGLVCGWLCRRGISAARRKDSPHGSFTVNAARIQCTASVDGDFSWDELTAFRWVLQQDEKNATLFERSDGTSSHRIPAQGFIIEAAQLNDPAQSDEHGYYNRPAIQFDLDDLCLTPPTRQDADAVIKMLNGLQAAAAAGTLRDGDMIAVPAILNAVSPAEPAQKPARPENVAVVRR